MSMFPCGNGTSATRSRLDQMIDRSGLIGERTRPACWFRRLAETNFSPFFSHKGRKGHREPFKLPALVPVVSEDRCRDSRLDQMSVYNAGKILATRPLLAAERRRPISLRRVLGGRRLLKPDSAAASSVNSSGLMNRSYAFFIGRRPSPRP